MLISRNFCKNCERILLKSNEKFSVSTKEISCQINYLVDLFVSKPGALQTKTRIQ